MLVQPLTAGFFLEAANPVLWLSYAFFFFFSFLSKILLKAWDGGGALLLILVLPFQECCSLCAFPPRALSGTLEPQDRVEVLLLVLPEGSSQPGLWNRLLQQHLMTRSYIHLPLLPAAWACCPPSPGSRTGGDRQQSPSETPTPVTCGSRPSRAVFLLSLLSLETGPGEGCR